jgi:hypothetical protein
MMKINFAKFILVLALALVGMNACYPSDFECADNNEVVSKILKAASDLHNDAADKETSESNSSDKDAHYCLCSLTCHTMFLSNSNFENFTYIVFTFPKQFQYTPQFYPQVTSSLEKPPTV